MTEPTEQEVEAQKAYDAAVEKMTDAAILQRVKAYHPNANVGPDQLKAMQDDYDRLKAEADKAASEQDPKQPA